MKKLNLKRVRVLPLQISVFIIGLILIESCQSNGLCYDIKTQELKSITNKKIQKIEINDSTNNQVYRIRFIDSQINALDKIDLNAIPISYQIERGWQNEKIENIKFYLTPNTVYKIMRSGGDASPQTISISTDKNGIVNESNCKCN